MAKPTILTVDDDPDGLAGDHAATSAARYGATTASSGSPRATRRSTSRPSWPCATEPVALIASDQRMPGMTGIEMLGARSRSRPDAKLLLLTAYADTDVAIKAINDIGLDYYLLKPWDPPEERLYPVVDDLLGDWQRGTPRPRLGGAGRRPPVVGADRTRSRRSWPATTSRTAGSTSSATTEGDAAARARRRRPRRPAARAALPDGDALRSPTPSSSPTRSGCAPAAEQPLYDLCIVGGGPAGLAAAVYAASEGLRDRGRRARRARRPGRAERGDRELPRLPQRAVRCRPDPRAAIAQVSRFGAEMVLARDVVGLETRGPVRAVRFDDGGEIEARAGHRGHRGLLPAARGRRALAELVGRGRLLRRQRRARPIQSAGDDVYVVGAANSAGQAALNLARYAKRVVLLVRGTSLEASMSHYLVERIRPRTTSRCGSAPRSSAAAGDGHLECADAVRPGHRRPRRWSDQLAVRLHRRRAAHRLARRRGRPRRHGFVLTGPDVRADGAGTGR